MAATHASGFRWAHHATSIAATVLGCLTLSGCAVFPRNELPKVSTFPPLSNEGDKVSVRYSFASSMDLFGKRPHAENLRIQLEREFKDVLLESGYFGVVSADKGDLNVAVTMNDVGSPAALVPAVITGLSLYTIPSWATDRFEITAKVTLNNGKVFKYELADSATLVQWLPMIFAAPFYRIDTIPRDVRKNLWRSLLLQMRNDGILNATPPGVKTSCVIRQGLWKPV